MGVQIEPGRRFVQVEAVVPGSQQQVWRAIATAEGVSSWFVPTEMELDAADRPVRIVSHFGPGMDTEARVTDWDPPQRFRAVSDGPGPDAPPIQTEWSIAPHPDGEHRVSVAHSIETDSGEWDAMLTGAEAGWPWFFLVLRAYLDFFADKPCKAFRLLGISPDSPSEAWAKFQSAMQQGAPVYAGSLVEHGHSNQPHGMLMRLDEPAPGILSAFCLPMGPRCLLVLDIFLYGEEASPAAAREEPLWREWMERNFPN